MSSLAATQADGYYIPPSQYDNNTKPGRDPPSKNQVAQSKGHNQFVQRGIVRFELPFAGRCQGCGHCIGRGSRFNAKKTKAGNYFSTPIWQFEMTCRACQQQVFIIQTNPQEYGFDYVSGISKSEFKIGETELVANVVASTPNELERLERTAHGERKVMSEYDELQALHALNQQTYQQDADCNARIRSAFRTERQAHQRRVQQARSKGWWSKPGMELLDEDADGRLQARSVVFGQQNHAQQQYSQQLQKSALIFSSSLSAKRRGKKRPRIGMKSISAIGPDGVVSDVSASLPNTLLAQQQQQQLQPLKTKKRRLLLKIDLLQSSNQTIKNKEAFVVAEHVERQQQQQQGLRGNLDCDDAITNMPSVPLVAAYSSSDEDD